ncbi:MAG: hypothetical protein ACE5HO_18065 [bacterium]
MKKAILFFFLCLFAGSATQAHAVSEAAVLFLLIQPSVRANGMAGTSVATSDHGALSAAFNPAHVGLATFERAIHVEFYPSKTNWLPQLNIDGLTFDAKSVLLGYNLRKLNKHLPFSIGFGYSRIELNLGTQIFTDENGPDPLRTFDSSESVDIWTVGVGLDYLVRIGFGFNFKNIDSNLAALGATGELESNSASTTAHGFGLIVQLPIIEMISTLRSRETKPGKNVRPFFVPAFGFSKGNVGDKIVFGSALQADPLPRVARMGIRFHTGLTYTGATAELRVVSFEWSSEAEDLLVSRMPDGSFRYDSGTGAIGFFDNVVKGNANQEIITRQGWELNLGDVFTYSQGSYEDPGGSVFYDTHGFGVSFTGALRLAGLLGPAVTQNAILGFISRHLDLEYHHSSFDAQRANPLANTSFNGLRISFF